MNTQNKFSRSGERSPFTGLLPRRQALALGGLALGWQMAGRWMEAPLAAAAAEKAPLVPFNRFPHTVQEYFVNQVRQAEQRGLALKQALKSRSAAKHYVEDVQRKIHDAFGPLPEKTPLNPRVTGVVERDAYNIEKIIFESRPEFYVTANLYVPKGRKFPLPGVVVACGHSGNGKAMENYQSAAQALARLGYVSLIYDPIGQGERLQYTDEKLKPRRGTGVSEHLYAGNQQFLVGEFFGTWRAWDGIRALDYLLTRPEVDPKHVGITGNSGGGTLTTWLCALERRWTMGAPACFITTFRRNMENELPADTEQCPPRALALALDHDDFLAAMAPNPIIILAKEQDFFDIRGAQESFQRLKHLYTLLGAPENIQIAVGPGPHGFSQENREAMYRWFNRATKISDAQTEPTLTIEKDETLYCTPNGQIAGIKSRPLYSFTQAKSQTLAARRPKKDGKSLQRDVVSILKLPERKGVVDFRILRTESGRQYPKPAATVYPLETEPGIFAFVTRLYDGSHQSRPPQGPKQAILYIADNSADEELRQEPLIRELMKAAPDAPVYACDVRGIGESRPDTCGKEQYKKPYGSDYFYAIHSIMLDRPYVGQRTHDVLCVLDWLASFGHTEVHLAGRGWGALPATFAALLANEVTQVTLKNALTSYSAVAESEAYDWPLSALPFGVLAHFDLPDVYRALEKKGLRQIEPRGAV